MVAFDAAGPSSAGTSFTTGPGTWTHVNGGTGILIGVTIFTGSANTVTACTYGGVTVPLVKFQVSASGGAGGIALYGLAGPACPTGSNTVSVTCSDTNNHNCGSVTLTDADSIGTPVSGPAAGTTGLSLTVPGTTTGGLIVSAACQGGDGTFTATSPNIKRVQHLNSSSSGADNLTIGTDPSTGGGASQAVAWTCAVSDDWGMVAVEVLPPSGPESGPNPAGSGTDLGGGTGTWTSPGSITADDGTSATWTVT